MKFLKKTYKENKLSFIQLCCGLLAVLFSLIAILT